MPRRKKIWQIESCYHCSVIGACLSRQDLRLLAKKKTYSLPRGSNDYELHRILTQTASVKSPQSRALTRYLDNKFKENIRKYSHFTDEDSLLVQWKADLITKDIAGAYWAIMTNPAISPAISSDIYGDCHILGYDFFSSARINNNNLQKMSRKNEMLKSLYRKKQAEWLAERELMQKQLSEFSSDQKLSFHLQSNNHQLQQENERLKSQKSHQILKYDNTRLKNTVAKSEKQIIELRAQIETLKKEVKTVLTREENATLSLKEKKESFRSLEQQYAELQKENTYLEQSIYPQILDESQCDECPENLSGKCPGPELCGKTILYVGGRINMIPRYRKLIESAGGTFLYHDGGKENSRRQLPKILSGADAVFCPVDCVSHDGCECVKKICKRYHKPFVMMRSAGLSSLAKGLSLFEQ